jgi:hypothetical protein
MMALSRSNMPNRHGVQVESAALGSNQCPQLRPLAQH